MKPVKPRPVVSACYDHLSGIVGEKLTDKLVELGWVSPEPAPGVTPLGWKGFADLGIDLLPLTTSRRKPVAFCTDPRRDVQHEHLGGHLGALVRYHFLAQGWLRMEDGNLAVTPEGEQALRNLGLDLEASS